MFYLTWVKFVQLQVNVTRIMAILRYEFPLHSNIAMDVADDIWHHVCVVREGETGLLAFFKDGERNYQSNEFRAGSLNARIEGNKILELSYVGGSVRLLLISS